MVMTLAGCASERQGSFALTSTAGIAATSATRPPSPSGTSAAAAVPGAMPKKNIADRVLTAIALERVTGLKPDPSRLVP
jgi:hypothetical protein